MAERPNLGKFRPIFVGALVELDGYTFISNLGEGQAKTWRARRDSDGIDVAIKTLELARVDDWKGIELFEREVKTLQQLDNPSIPKFIDFVEDQKEGSKRWHIVQQFCDGTTADKSFPQGINEQVLRALAVYVLNTLQYLQSFSPPLFHRDIKPQNLIVHDHGVFVIDFGSVRHVVPSRTGGSTVAGTSGFMAPEQLMGRADKSSDLYGLGMVLVSLITGVEPDELPKQRMKIDWRSYAKVGVSVPFSKFIDRLIEPHPEERFESAADALARMDEVAPPQSLIVNPDHKTFKVTETADGALLARSLGFSLTPTSVAGSVAIGFAVVILAFLLPLVLLILPFILIYLALISTNTLFRFNGDNVEIEKGWLFKNRYTRPTSLFVDIPDPVRKEASLNIAGLQVTNRLSFRERSVLRAALEEKAVSSLNRVDDIPNETSFDFKKSPVEEKVVATQEVNS